MKSLLTRAPSLRMPWGSMRGGDAALAVAVGVVQVVATLTVPQQHHRAALDVGGVALLIAGPAALLVRRRAPTAVLAFVFATALAFWLLNYPHGPVLLALAVAVIGAILAGRRRAGWLALALGHVGFLWLPHWLGIEPAPNVGHAVGLVAWLLVLGGATEIVRVRRRRAGEVALSRRERDRRRASEERLRIARELHDTVAHNLSLIHVHANVARHLIDERPEQTRAALDAIKGASKEALDELRSVLDLLRAPDERAPLAPTPGLGQLGQLIARTRDAGIVVRAETEGAPTPLPAAVDLAAFRIVQEALTNVTRHAPSAATSVRVAYYPGELLIQVENDPCRVAINESSSAGGGNGIGGMRERVGVLGGDLFAGPRGDGGFRVLARLPLSETR